MSGAHNSTLTRRSFLKTTGAAAGLAAAGCAGAALSGDVLSPAKAHAEGEERIAFTYHQNHCGGNCSLKCTVRDGRLCHIEPNDAVEDIHYAKCCLKGLSEIEHIYNPNRIQTPLKRVGKRGAGEFEVISWDEAYDILIENLQSVWDKYGKEAVHVRACSEADDMSLLGNILGARTAVFGGIDMGIGSGFDPAFGGWGYGSAFSDSRDWASADFMLNVGANLLESSLIESSRFFDAKEAGCRIVTVDPHFCTTAQKSDEWLPIKPATDGALYLGMISHVLDNDYIDEAFIKEHTTLPFLVEKESGAFFSFDPEGDAAKMANPMETAPRAYAVWDTVTNSAVPFDSQGADPAIEGVYEIDGRSYVPAMVLLRENQRSYTTAWAAEVTGIPEEKIIEIATGYATSRASILSFGLGGNDKMGNADIVGHAAAVLVAITGQAGHPGASAGNWAGGGGLGAPYLGPGYKLPEECQTSMFLQAVPLMRSSESGIHALVTIGDIIQQSFPTLNVTAEWLDSLDFICVMDVYHMTSVDYADLVLPLCTRFESEEEIGGVKSANFHVRLREKVIDPLFDSRQEYRVCYEIAERLGYADGMPRSTEELVRNQLANSPDPSVAGITVESLVEHSGIQAPIGYEVVRNAYPDAQFATKTQRAEVYYDNLLAFGQALPNYEDALEANEDNPLRATFPFQLSNARSRYHIHCQFFDAAWIQEYNTGDCELNPRDMDEYDLSNGDKIEIYNDRGTVILPVRGNAAVRPRCLRIHEGIWTKFTDSGNFQMLTNDTLSERGSTLAIGPVIPFNDTLVAIRKA